MGTGMRMGMRTVTVAGIAVVLDKVYPKPCSCFNAIYRLILQAMTLH